MTGEAIADGCALKTNYFHKHHGLTETELSTMTIDKLESHERMIKMKNVWCIAEDVRSRIDDEPGPGESFMQAFLTERKGWYRLLYVSFFNFKQNQMEYIWF